MPKRRINRLGIPGICLTSKPRMTMHRGRTWDTARGFLPAINDEPPTEVTCHLDTTWGEYFYFSYKNDWYRGRIYDFDWKDGDSLKFDLAKRHGNE